MPTYTFRNKKTGKTWDELMYMSELDEFLAENPNVEQLITSAPGIGDAIRLGLQKPDDAFRDRLKDIKASHRGSKINTW